MRRNPISSGFRPTESIYKELKAAIADEEKAGREYFSIIKKLEVLKPYLSLYERRTVDKSISTLKKIYTDERKHYQRLRLMITELFGE